MMGHRMAYSAEGQINRNGSRMEFEMLADNRVVVSHEIKIFIEVELVEQTQGQPAAAGGRARSTCRRRGCSAPSAWTRRVAVGQRRERRCH